MAMSWLVVLVLFTQTFRALSCAFDKVETMTGYPYKQFTFSNENDCFARCFEDMACIGIGYRKMSHDGYCQLFSAGETEFTKRYESDNLYSFQRDDVDPTGCTRYVGV